jgi:DNA-binding NtrC family response regulator
VIPRPTVLIVDDHSDSLALYSALMSEMGFDSVAVDSMAKAKKLCHRRTFDLVICDIKLRDGNGLDLLRELRPDCHIPGIAISGLPANQVAEQAIDAGFAMFMEKPVDLDELQAAAERLTASNAQEARAE